MKKTKNLFKMMITVVTLFSLVISCSKDDSKSDASPKACFTTSSIFYKIDEVISFQNCSQNYDRVEWNFGDGESSTLTEPSHSYKKKGIYDVTLTAFKGTSNSKITVKVCISIIPYFNVSSIFTKWKNLPSKYNGVSVSYYLCNSDNNEVIKEMNGGKSFTLSDITSATSAGAFIPITTNRIDYKIKFVMYGCYTDPNDNQYDYSNPLDSFYTDNFSIYSGPKTPDNTYNLPHLEMSNHLSMDYY